MGHTVLMKTILTLLLVGLIFLMSATAKLAQRKSIEISGRAIDEKGRGIQGALVSIDYPPCKNCFEHILPSFETLPEGGFVIEAPLVSARKVTLFIEEPIPKGFWAPYRPFVGNLSQARRYKGTTIILSKQSRVEVGDVRVHVLYGKVSVALAKCEQGRSLSSSPEIGITIKNRTGVVVQQMSVPKTAIDFNGSMIKLALPVGKWELTFSLRDPNGGIERHVRVDITPSANLSLDLCSGG